LWVKPVSKEIYKKGELMKPYKNIQSHNLALLLLLARVTAYLGIILGLLLIAIGILMVVNISLYEMATVLPFVTLSVGILFLSGLMAALVSIEENYRIRTLHIVSKNET